MVSMSAKKYLPYGAILFKKPVIAHILPSGNDRATINAPPESANSFNASVQAPSMVGMFIRRLGR